MSVLKYYTIKPDESAKDLLRKIKFEYPLRWLYVFEDPVKLGGTQKILVIRVRKSPGTIIKVDGPGWIIEQIKKIINDGEEN